MKNVVIVGGGFAGGHAAKKLQKQFNVTLIDTKDYFEYTPGILRTIVEEEHASHIQTIHKKYLKKAHIIREHVHTITDSHVILKNTKLPFDYLIISTGSRYHEPLKEEDVVITTRADELREYHGKVEKAQKILVVGGGISGVELAAEIACKYRDKEITLVHSHDKLMERNTKKVGTYSEKFLKKKGVKIIFGERSSEKNEKIFITDKGTKIEADIAFFAVGIQPNNEIVAKSFPDKVHEKGWILVNDHLQLEGHTNIFSAGDCNSVNEEKTAQNAEFQADVVIENIHNLEKGNPLEKYSTSPKIMVISLGKWNGIITKGNFVMTGLIPGLFKTIVEKYIMSTFK